MSDGTSPGDAVEKGEATAQAVAPGRPGAGRSYVTTLAVLAIASAAALWALQQVWVSAEVRDGDLPASTVELTGASLYPVSVAAAWVALAATVAVIATRGRVRSVIGALILVCAAGIGVSAIAFPLSSHIEMVSASRPSGSTAAAQITASTTNYWLIMIAALVLIGACGIATLVLGSRWRSLSSRQSAGPRARASAWDDLDRGIDPTVPPEQRSG